MTLEPSATLVAGAAGRIGRVLVPALVRSGPVIALDPQPVTFASKQVRNVQGSLTDEELLRELLHSADAVVHLATTGQSWRGLWDVEINGSRTLFQAAVAAGVRRVVIMSSNHVLGGYERDLLIGESDEMPSDLAAIVRPDSEYATAKAFIEAYGRYIAETTSTGVSCIRVGTVRSIDDPEQYVDAPEFAYIPGGREGRTRRLRATWLHHDDLIAITMEELAAVERFRLRFGVSDNPGRYWPLGVYKWDSDAVEGARYEGT